MLGRPALVGALALVGVVHGDRAAQFCCPVARATAAAPTYSPSQFVPLSVTLAGQLRTTTAAAAGGFLDSVVKVRRLDSIITQLPAGTNTLGRLRALDSLVGRVKWDTVGTSTSASSGNVSLGTSTGKVTVLLTGSLTTTAATADQVILTRTVTASKTLYLSYVCLKARLTAVSATASVLGAASVETPSGTKVYTTTFVNPTTSEVEQNCVAWGEPVPVAAGVVVRCVTTPTAVTSMFWLCNLGGYER